MGLSRASSRGLRAEGRGKQGLLGIILVAALLAAWARGPDPVVVGSTQGENDFKELGGGGTETWHEPQGGSLRHPAKEEGFKAQQRKGERTRSEAQ